MTSIRELGFSVLKNGAGRLYSMGAERWVRRIPGALSLYRFAYRSFRPQAEVLATIDGRKMLLDPKDMGASARLITLGIFEPVETDLFKSLIGKGSVVVDIGANIGFYTLLAADLVGERGRVFAFEPVPKNLALLRKSIQANGYKNIIVVPMAVSNRRETVGIVTDHENWGFNHITQVHPEANSLQVETITLDEFLAEYGLKVDVIKIDAEGAEASILQGALELFARNPDLTILTEYNPKLISAFGYEPGNYLHELASLGFELLCLDEVTQQRKPLSAEMIDQFTEFLCRQQPGRDFVNLLCLRGRGAARWHAYFSQNPETVPVPA